MVSVDGRGRGADTAQLAGLSRPGLGRRLTVRVSGLGSPAESESTGGAGRPAAGAGLVVGPDLARLDPAGPGRAESELKSRVGSTVKLPASCPSCVLAQFTRRPPAADRSSPARLLVTLAAVQTRTPAAARPGLGPIGPSPRQAGSRQARRDEERRRRIRAAPGHWLTPTLRVGVSQLSFSLAA